MSDDTAAVNAALLLLEPRTVGLNQLHLDPNNPRLMGLRDDAPDGFTDEEIVEAALQEQVLKKLSEDRIGLTDLTAKIRTNGFLAIDRIVVKALGVTLSDGSETYVVLEGNRRVGALKTITGTPTMLAGLSDRVKASFTNLAVLVYEGDDPDVAWHIQGLRHIEGIKEWGPFQKARYLHDTHRDPQQLKQQTGISVQQINRLLRSYNGFQQALADDDWGDSLHEDDFALFNEGVFAKPVLQDWLEWNDRDQRFRSTENLSRLLQLRKEPLESGSTRIQKVNPELRDWFAKLLEAQHKPLLERFLNDDLPLDKAYAQAKQKETEHEIDLDEQARMLEEAQALVVKLPVLEIIRDEQQRSQFKLLLQGLREDCAGQIQLLGAQLAAEE